MDLLVKLYDFDAKSRSEEIEKQHKIKIFRPLSPNKSKVINFIRENFGIEWADECSAAFSNTPVTCFIAVNDKREVIGFAAYEATAKAFFGPIGIHPDYRKFGLGKELLVNSLNGLKELGYQYAIIGGGSGKAEFYNKVCGAILIEDSEPGIYKNMI